MASFGVTILRMKIALGSDHAGFELKEKLRAHLEKGGRQVNDLGTANTDSVDYPDFAQKVAHEVTASRADLGVLVCGSGIGMSIAANKVTGIRAAHVSDEQDARLSRQHNNANVLAIGARILGEEKAIKIVDIFLNTTFAGGRHEQRVQKIAKIEAEECKGRSS
jgi:ribose 5-phosphate isomerase B